jgi:hypothetical protein
MKAPELHQYHPQQVCPVMHVNVFIQPEGHWAPHWTSDPNPPPATIGFGTSSSRRWAAARHAVRPNAAATVRDLID